MAKVSLAQIVEHCEKLLKTEQFSDWDGAVNGLQVENSGAVTRIAAAVDASLATVKLAIAEGADLMIVHHGLFWGKTIPWTGKRREMIKLLIDNNLAVYSSHLPMDAHPKLGNNALLCRALGFKNLKPFFPCKGRDIGWQTRTADLARASGGKIGWKRARPCSCAAARRKRPVRTHWRGYGRRGRGAKNSRGRRRGYICHRRRSALDIRAG